jgi:hypothetical protein
LAHSRGKTFLGALFFIIWVFSLVFIKPVTPEILLCLNIPILFIWLGLGQRLGGLSSVISCLYALLFSKTNAYILPVASFIAVSAYAWSCNNILENEIKKAEVNEEKIYEEINLYRNEIKIAQKDNSRMRNSLEMISRLKGIVEKYSQTVSEEDILDSIVNNASELFPDAKRTLLYLVDTEKQELRLVRSRKKESAFPIKAKKGDVFDRMAISGFRRRKNSTRGLIL